MKKIALLLGLFMLVFTGILLADNERIAALGGNAGFWPGDSKNIELFPQTMKDWNIALTDGADFKVVWGEGTKWGFKGGAEDDLLNLYLGTGDLGMIFGIEYKGEWDEVIDDTTITYDAEYDFSASFGKNMGFGELGVGFDYNSDGDMALDARLRRDHNLWLFDKMLVGFSFTSPDVGDSYMNFGLDFFTHIPIANKTTGLFAVGFGYEGGDDNVKFEDAILYFPKLTFAVESYMTDWATVRCGFTKNYDIGNQEGEEVAATFGLGFNYGGFNLDMCIGTDLFKDPVAYITGHNDTPLTTAFDISYTW